ncbi:MAG TPA: DNA repair protein RecO [Lacibacter sp.]|nr:DNA repair protein RecO [Lacibacter sp.]HMO88078.1 DNA repair protein RecO [Lacibacter sp.]HMP86464.1 DNA repair protein RecO [Lacibacter sp.]
MTPPLHKTKGLVLRAVKYGETSLIVSVYTELFGLQSYLVQGVRLATKKSPARANLFQPGSLLDLVVYHNELRQLQRIREFRWAVLYRDLFSDVVKNSVLLFILELVQKSIRQPECNPDLFAFLEDALLELDQAPAAVTANFPLYFLLHFCAFSGFQLSDPREEDAVILDLREGCFTRQYPQHGNYVDGTVAQSIRELLKVMQPHELTEIPLQQLQRRRLLETLELYYALHLPEFGKMKTLPVLQEVLG